MMKIRKTDTILAAFACAAAALCVTSCKSVSYQGETRPETQYSKIFTNSFFIGSGYQLMGTGSYLAEDGEKGRDVKEVLLRKCREVGADAVLVEGVGAQAVSKGSDETKLAAAPEQKTEPSDKSQKKAASSKSDQSPAAVRKDATPNERDVQIPLLIKGDTLISVSFYKYNPPSTEAILKKGGKNINMDQILETQASKGVKQVEELVDKQKEKDASASPKGGNDLKMEGIPSDVNKSN